MMLNWVQGDLKPEGEWNAILEAHDRADFIAVVTEDPRVAAIMRAIQAILRRAIETHYGWDEAVWMADVLNGGGDE